MPDLQLAILQQDRRCSSAIPGIGKKLAERVIFELKEKVAAAGSAALAGVSGPVGGETEVVGALQALGYSASEAREASAPLDPAIGGTLEDRVKAALRTLLRECVRAPGHPGALLGALPASRLPCGRSCASDPGSVTVPARSPAACR